MPWTVRTTQEYDRWSQTLSDAVKAAIRGRVRSLKDRGPELPRPYADTLKGSRHANMKELRVQQAGEPYRIFFAFDPSRAAILLIGGNKAGDKRFYKRISRSPTTSWTAT